MKLSPTMKKFVLHWGEMGARWGINRTVAQVHALLFLSPQPLHAEQICAALGVARSNVSTSLKELQGWGLVRVVHVFGDRRDHFESHQDVWEMFRRVSTERKRREIDPTLAMLRTAIAGEAGGSDDYALARLRDLQQFLETLTAWYDQLSALPPSQTVRFLKLSGQVLRRLKRGDGR